MRVEHLQVQKSLLGSLKVTMHNFGIRSLRDRFIIPCAVRHTHSLSTGAFFCSISCRFRPLLFGPICLSTGRFTKQKWWYSIAFRACFRSEWPFSATVPIRGFACAGFGDRVFGRERFAYPLMLELKRECLGADFEQGPVGKGKCA